MLVFSCPGGYNLPFCHRFQLGIAPCACFFHVPEPISYLPATDSALPQSPFNQPRLVTVMFIKIPESGDSTLGAAFQAPGSPWLRYLYELQFLPEGLIEGLCNIPHLSVRGAEKIQKINPPSCIIGSRNL